MKRKAVSPRRRLEVWQRDRFQCAYCGASAMTDFSVILEVDHVVPVASGGANDIGNLKTACRPCNQRKGPRGWRGDAMAHISIGLPQSAADRMKAIAADRGSSFADVVREAVRVGLRSIEQRERRAS